MKFSSLSKLLRGRADPPIHDLPRDVDRGSGPGGGYDPHQPRVPAGHSDGGRWTRQSGLGRATFQTSEPDRSPAAPDGSFMSGHLPDGFQLARDTNFPITRNPRVSSREFIPWLISYNMLAAHDRRGERQTFIRFSAHGAEGDDAGTFAYAGHEQLTSDQFTKRCHQLENAYRVALQADKDVRDKGLPVIQPQFGTAVHVRAKKIIDDAHLEGKLLELDAELTFWDGNKPIDRQEFERLKGLEAAKQPPSGTRGTIRTDILEEIKPDTVCVYDIKTGREPLTPGRIAQIIRSVTEHDQRMGKPLKHILITSVHMPGR